MQSFEPDLALARRFLRQEGPEGRPLLCAITGSHHYGFASADSDLDIKGIHAVAPERLLGLSKPKMSHDRLQVFEGLECDLTCNEARQALRLLLGGNGNMLERIFSPYQLLQGPDFEGLRGLAQGAINQSFFKHYGGFFRGICREHERSPEPSAKGLLYAYRVALTGVHLLRSGQVLAHLPTLAPLYGFSEALELITLKQEAHEKALVSSQEDQRHRARWPDLEAALSEAKVESFLPERPSNREECQRWLVDLRLQALRL